MATLSAQDIKDQIIKEVIEADQNKSLPEGLMASADKHIEVGIAINRMTQTSGWKILEYWILNQLDINGLLNAEDAKLSQIRSEGRAYAKILSQVEQWKVLAERLQKQKDQNKQS